MTGIRLTFTPPIPRDIRRAVRDACRQVSRVIEIRHHLPVTVVPRDRVTSDVGPAWGAFWYDDGPPHIFIAGHLDELPKSQRAANVVDTLMHECVHYLQWANGEKIQERGVAVRARNIAKRLAA